jgi:crotonobetainyl-CoA:carnitine CoA-transferase CaiB-like acyl-CoA transferase
MLPQADGTPRGTAPVPGQHTREILVEHGYGGAEIDALLAQRVVAAA